MFSTFWRFRRFIRPYRGPGIVGGALVLLVAATDIAAPWPLKVVVDNVLRNQPLTGPVSDLFDSLPGSGTDAILTAAVVLLIGLVALNAFADYLSSYALDGMGQRVMADLRSQVFT